MAEQLQQRLNIGECLLGFLALDNFPDHVCHVRNNLDIFIRIRNGLIAHSQDGDDFFAAKNRRHQFARQFGMTCWQPFAPRLKQIVVMNKRFAQAYTICPDARFARS